MAELNPEDFDCPNIFRVTIGADDLIVLLGDLRELKVPFGSLDWLEDAAEPARHQHRVSDDQHHIIWPLLNKTVHVMELLAPSIPPMDPQAKKKWRRYLTGVTRPHADAQSVTVGDHYLTVEAIDGRIVSWPLAEFPFLQKLTLKQRQKFKFANHPHKIYWPKSDEFVSVDHLFGHSCR